MAAVKNQPGIIGKLRNDYNALLSAFAQKYPAAEEYEGIKLVNPLPGVAGVSAASELSILQPALTIIRPIRSTTLPCNTPRLASLPMKISTLNWSTAARRLGGSWII